jgi:hypothetical protein
MPNTWKVLAIVFMIIFVIENLFLLWMYFVIVEDYEKERMCHYDICKDYPSAYYEYDVCACYDYDILGNLEVVKYKIMD